MKKEYSDIITWLALAGAGGLARFLASQMDPDAKQLTLKRFLFQALANMLVSGFAGVMGALMMSQIAPEAIILQHASAGIFGYMGHRSLEAMAEKLNQKL